MTIASGSSWSARARSAAWPLDREGLGGEDHRTTVHTTPLLVQRRSGIRCPRHLGRTRRVAGRSRHTSGLGAVLGAGEHDVQGPDRAATPNWPGRSRCTSRGAGGTWQLTPAWLSRDMDLAEETVVANGIVFAYAAGRGCVAGHAGQGMDEPGGPVYGGGLSSGPARCVPTVLRRALRARRSEREGTVVERQPD